MLKEDQAASKESMTMNHDRKADGEEDERRRRRARWASCGEVEDKTAVSVPKKPSGDLWTASIIQKLWIMGQLAEVGDQRQEQVGAVFSAGLSLNAARKHGKIERWWGRRRSTNWPHTTDAARTSSTRGFSSSSALILKKQPLNCSSEQL